jgi:uncharacterized protein involved in exopolysaccharide biosynthesis
MEELISLQEAFRFAQRQRRRILGGMAATVGAVLLLTFLMAPTYEAVSLLLVRFGREYLYRPEVGADTSGNPAVRDRQTFIKNELQILRSKDLIEGVVTSVGVNKLYPKISDQPRPSDPNLVGAAVLLFLQNLYTDPVLDSDVIRVAFRHSDPATAAKALNLLLDQFKDKHLLAFSDPQATAFLQEKVSQSRDELTKVDEKLNALHIDTKLFASDDNDQRADAVFKPRRDLEAAFKETRSQIAGLEEKLTYLRSEREKASADTSRPASEQNRAIADARAQLLELELQEQTLLTTFSENSRSVVSVRQQIQLVKDFLDKQKAAIGEGELAEDLEKQIVAVVADLRFQEARRDSLVAQMAQLDKELGQVPEQAAQYRDLVRQREAVEMTYEKYVKKLEEARLSEAMDREKIANVSVIQSAAAPLIPIWPSKLLNLLVGLFLGACVGIGWALAAEWLARRRGLGDAVVGGPSPAADASPKLGEGGRNVV